MDSAMKNSNPGLVSITGFALAILMSLFTPSLSHARWEVERVATRTSELPDTRILENEQSRVLGYSTLRRTIPTSFGDLQVATIANSVLKKDPKTDVSILKMAEGVREAMKSPAWTREVQDGVTHFTANWPKEHRFLRLAIREEKDRWLISFSSVRTPFVKIGAEESDLLQRAFFIVESAKKKKPHTQVRGQHCARTFDRRSRSRFDITGSGSASRIPTIRSRYHRQRRHQQRQRTLGRDFAVERRRACGRPRLPRRGE